MEPIKRLLLVLPGLPYHLGFIPPHVPQRIKARLTSWSEYARLAPVARWTDPRQSGSGCSSVATQLSSGTPHLSAQNPFA